MAEIEPVVEPEVSDEPVKEPVTIPEPEPGIEEREPDGDSPEAVFARKQYRTAKTVQAELDRERLERARVEERARILEEQLKRSPATSEERVYTIAEINAAVDAGTITRAIGDQYIDEKIIPARIDARLKARDSEAQKNAPLQKALVTVEEYIALIPGLQNKSSEEFSKVANRYRKIVTDDGMPDDVRSQKLALEFVYGSLDGLRKKAEMAKLNSTPRTIPSDAGAGGGQRSASGKVDLTKAPAHLLAFWDRTGTPPADREREMGYWLKGQPKK